MWVVFAILFSLFFQDVYGDPVMFTDPAGPIVVENRFADHSDRSDRRPIRVVSFNLHYSEDIEGAIHFLRNTDGLRDADILFLQEVTADNLENARNAAGQIAEALHMNYSFSPAMIHPGPKKPYGNAIV